MADMETNEEGKHAASSQVDTVSGPRCVADSFSRSLLLELNSSHQYDPAVAVIPSCCMHVALGFLCSVMPCDIIHVTCHCDSEATWLGCLIMPCDYHAMWCHVQPTELAQYQQHSIAGPVRIPARKKRWKGCWTVYGPETSAGCWPELTRADLEPLQRGSRYGSRTPTCTNDQ